MAARPWILERRDGLEREIYICPAADDRLSGEQILSEVPWCLNTLMPGGGYSAYQFVFGSNPIDSSGRDDKDGDLPSAQGTSPSGQFAQQWKLRTMAQEAAVEEVANGALRRLLP